MATVTSSTALWSSLWPPLLFHGYVYNVVKADDIAKRREDPLFQVTFEEQLAVESTEIIVGDGEQQTLSLDFSNDDFRSSNMLAMVAITVDYEETSGEVGDSCDVVNVNIPQLDLTRIGRRNKMSLQAMPMIALKSHSPCMCTPTMTALSTSKTIC